jgi:hypothetical protein
VVNFKSYEWVLLNSGWQKHPPTCSRGLIRFRDDAALEAVEVLKVTAHATEGRHFLDSTFKS